MVQIHVCEPPGDILVFLTGEEEIEDACKKIAKEITQMGEQARRRSRLGFINLPRLSTSCVHQALRNTLAFIRYRLVMMSVMLQMASAAFQHVFAQDSM